jgi:hypothetical protein
MHSKPTHVPEAPRHLPADLYGHFDIRGTPDGGRQYSLPHTLASSVMTITTEPRMLALLIAAALAWSLIVPVREAASPLSTTWLYAMLVFFLLHLIAVIGAAIAMLISGVRIITRITIRPDGLILNDASFYAAEDLWMIGYGVTHNEGKADETFTPKITLQVGTHLVTIADGLDVQSAKLFMRLFQEDTRRYWHRHN